MGEAIIVKTLEDPEIGIALVTSLQIVEAAYLELRTVHMDDLDEARNALEKPIEDSFGVNLSNFIEQCTFLGANQATVSPVEMIRTLTISIKNLPILNARTIRFNEFYSLPVNRTTANFVLTFVLEFEISRQKKPDTLMRSKGLI